MSEQSSRTTGLTLADPQRLVRGVIFVLAIALAAAIFLDHNVSYTAYYLLALGGVVVLFSARNVAREEWIVIFAILAVVITAWLSVAWNGFEKRDWDRFLEAQTPLLGLIPVYFLARQFEMSAAIWWAAVVGALMCGALAAHDIYTAVDRTGLSWTLDRVWGGNYRVSADDNPLSLAFTALVFAAVLMAGVAHVTRGRGWVWLLWICALVLSLMAIVLSKSRGAWISIPALLLIFLFVHWYVLPMRLRVVAVAAMLALPLLALSVPTIQSRITLAVAEFERFDPQSDPGSAHTSVGLRLDTYRAAWAAFLEKPLLGYGPGSWEQAFRDAEEEGIARGKLLKHPHNMYLSSLALRGFIGFFAEMALFTTFSVYLLRRLHHEDRLVRDLALAGVFIVATVLIMGATWIPFGWWRKQATLLAFLLAAIMGTIRYWEMRKQRDSHGTNSSNAAG